MCDTKYTPEPKRDTAWIQELATEGRAWLDNLDTLPGMIELDRYLEDQAVPNPK